MASASIVGTWDSGTATASGTWSCEIYYPSTITYPGGSTSKTSSGTYSGSWGPIAHAAGASVTYSVSSPVAYSSVTISAASPPPSGGGGDDVSVVNVVGRTEENAEQILVVNGFGATFAYTTVGATKLNHGLVKSQSPAAGTLVAPGTTVTAEVYLFPNWFNLDGELLSNDGSYPGANPGIRYYAAAKNDFNLNAQFSWSISNTSLSGGGTLTSLSPTATPVPYSSTNPNVFLNQALEGSGATFVAASYATTYTLTVTAQALSSGGVPISPVETRNFQVTTPPVPVVAPSWSDNTLSSDFRVGEAYSDSVSASGTAPITYSVSAGSLPAGITRSGGALSGTPTTAGPYSFTISATNSAGSISASFSGTVGGPKGGLYVFDGTNWIQSTANVLNGSGGSATAEVWYYNGTTWIKSF
jgi:hypothetical protein